MLAFSIKLPIVLPAKMDLFGNKRELQFRTSKLWQNHRQVQQAKERNIILWRRRKLRRVVEVHWKKARV